MLGAMTGIVFATEHIVADDEGDAAGTDRPSVDRWPCCIPEPSIASRSGLDHTRGIAEAELERWAEMAMTLASAGPDGRLGLDHEEEPAAHDPLGVRVRGPDRDRYGSNS